MNLLSAAYRSLLHLAFQDYATAQSMFLTSVRMKVQDLDYALDEQELAWVRLERAAYLFEQAKSVREAGRLFR